MKKKRLLQQYGWAWWSYDDEQYIDFTFYEPQYQRNVSGKWVRIKLIAPTRRKENE